jgi:hypothetical protein
VPVSCNAFAPCAPTRSTRARLALCTAQRDYRPSLLAQAAGDGRALISEDMPYTMA